MSEQYLGALQNTVLGAQIAAELSALPQYPLLDPVAMNRWVDRVCANDPDRLFWHIARASGFGGSDIGTLVEASRNVYSPFSSAHAIVSQKLLKYAPTPPTPAMRRGVDLEPIVKAMFQEEFSALELDHPLPPVANPDVPWMRYNPDFYCQLQDGSWALIDFKSTHDENIETYEKEGEVSFGYTCQLHQGATWLRSLGYQVDHLLLVSHNFEKWEIDTRRIEEDPNLHQEILDVGNFYWEQHVLTGITPSKIAKPEFQPDQITSLALKDKAARLLSLKVLHAELGKELPNWDAQLKAIACRYELGDAQLKLDGMQVTGKPVLNEAAITERLEEIGVPLADFEVAGEIDPEKAVARIIVLGEADDHRKTYTDFAAAYRFLVDRGDDSPQCRVETLSAAITRKKSGPEADAVKAQRAAARELIDNMIELVDPLTKEERALLESSELLMAQGEQSADQPTDHPVDAAPQASLGEGDLGVAGATVADTAEAEMAEAAAANAAVAALSSADNLDQGMDSALPIVPRPTKPTARRTARQSP